MYIHPKKYVYSFFERSYYIIVSSYLICHIVKLRVNFEQCFKGEIDPMSQIFYGHPLSYWEDRKEYWNDKRDLWISLESDIINFNYYNVLKDERYSINDKKNRRKQLKKKLSKKEVSLTHMNE